MRKIGTGLFIILSLLILCGLCSAGELDGTAWEIFVPSIKDGKDDIDDTIPFSFTDIQHDTREETLTGIFNYYYTKRNSVEFHGIATKVQDGYKFKIIIPDSDTDDALHYTGTLKTVSPKGYLPKGAFERKFVKTLESKGAKIIWAITDGIERMKSGKKIPNTDRTTLHFTGFVFKL